jgi:hypothetical protein
MIEPDELEMGSTSWWSSTRWAERFRGEPNPIDKTRAGSPERSTLGRAAARTARWRALVAYCGSG